MAVPVGEKANTFKGVIALSEAAAYLLSHMEHDRSKEDLIALLITEFDVTESIAKKDIEMFIDRFSQLGLIVNETDGIAQ